MKKLGFTLAEIIIAVAVVGAIAAVSIPLVNTVIPDGKKVQVLKTYKQLISLNQELLSSPSIYVESNGCTGLDCTQEPLGWSPANEILKDYVQGDTKYIAILADFLNATEFDFSSEVPNFTTRDGVVWSLSKEDEDDLYILTIDIDSSGDDCIHSDECENPDQFKFLINPMGKVFGGDSLTITYLANPHKLSDRKNDFKNSIKYANELEEQAKAEAEKAKTENSQ